MRAVDLIRLVLLASIWGASFIFVRVLSPVIGPVMTADFRVLIAGIFLCIYFKIAGIETEWGRAARLPIRPMRVAHPSNFMQFRRTGKPKRLAGARPRDETRPR